VGLEYPGLSVSHFKAIAEVEATLGMPQLNSLVSRLADD
jgi:hypothetical protein